MNYPIWDVPASGLFIAAIAVLHVFIAHFAIGGGLFLVFYETKARREGDPHLLDYVRLHSRFFVLVTLVLGAVTGVGIWFTIGLVHPEATSMLIQNFVWIWAIEWTFFVTEIAAALVYYYGWDRLSGRTHLTVGWIYFGSAWMSLFAINGILTFMLTPGGWLQSSSLWDAFFNPTFWPSLLTRTLVAFGLAGLYAFLTAAFLKRKELASRITRYAAVRWVVPTALLMPFGLQWYLSAAEDAGIPAAEILGLPSASLISMVGSAFSGGASASGYPYAISGAFVGLLSATALVALTLLFGVWRPGWMKPAVAGVLLLLGLGAFGSAEWIREDLRKPYVLSGVMFVNRIRMPAESWSGSRPLPAEDPFSLSAVNEKGVLKTALWIPDRTGSDSGESEPLRKGEETFRMLCSSCHTLDGYLAVRPLLEGKNPAAIESILDQLAQPVGADGESVSWNSPGVRLKTWRGRRMPPFAGTPEEKERLALYLASLVGTHEQEAPARSSAGRQVFEEKCIFCHSPESDWPISEVAGGLSLQEFYDRIGMLPELNPVMPPFDGSEEEREALAEYLAEIAGKEPQ